MDQNHDTFVGRVFVEDGQRYLVIDVAGKYGRVDLATGQAELPDTLTWLLTRMTQDIWETEA
jgi:hypothetical protein